MGHFATKTVNNDHLTYTTRSYRETKLKTKDFTR